MSDALPVFETVVLERDDAVATLTMNRPERRNALNRDLERDLMAALEAVRDDDAVRAAVLTGAGAGFCAGADLTSFAEMPRCSSSHSRAWPLSALAGSTSRSRLEE